MCPVSAADISTCGAPFVVSPVAATIHVVTDDLGHVDEDLTCVEKGCPGNVTSHVDLTYDDTVPNHNGVRLVSKQSATHRSNLRCASLKTTDASGKYVPPSAAGAWSHAECTISTVTAGSVYRCTCTRVGIAVALSLPGGYVAAEWNTAAAASTCYDGVRNGAETGVDCGGVSCDACPTCADGVKNGDETGVDCGGSCAACATCSDGVKNGEETGVDCGGACAPCFAHAHAYGAWGECSAP